MEKNIHKYKLFGRRKGRKKNFNHLDKNFLKTILYISQKIFRDHKL